MVRRTTIGHEDEDYDLFISYGWSGVPNQDDGDRGWVGTLKKVLEPQLASNLGRRARIFLDVEQMHSGELPGLLEDALASSTLFLSILTPGSCQAKSWCRKEIKWFLDLAPQVLPRAAQVFAIRIRDVRDDEIPPQLRRAVRKDFLERGLPPSRRDLEDDSSHWGKMAQNLALQLATAIKDVEERRERTLFMAAVPDSLRASMAHIKNLLAMRDQSVILGEQIQDEDQETFARRIVRVLRGCGKSLHVLDSSIDARPKDWKDSPQLLQVTLARQRLGTEYVAVVANPNAPPPKLYGELLSGTKMLEKMGLQPIQSILRQGEAVPSQADLLGSQVSRVTYRVAVLNASATVTDGEARAVCSALQEQVRKDFAPVWGVDAELTLLPKGSALNAASWCLMILDTSDYEGWPSYHTLTPEGLPLVKVFVETARSGGWEWTMCASHELLEMLADPMINSAVLRETPDGTRQLYKRQVCDPCRDPRFAYRIDKVLVSDFVFPDWFEAAPRPGVQRFDFGDHIKTPFGLLPGASINVIEINANQRWQPLTMPSAQGARLVKKKKRHRS
jgi:hypothetical protein